MPECVVFDAAGTDGTQSGGGALPSAKTAGAAGGAAKPGADAVWAKVHALAGGTGAAASGGVGGESEALQLTLLLAAGEAEVKEELGRLVGFAASQQQLADEATPRLSNPSLIRS